MRFAKLFRLRQKRHPTSKGRVCDRSLNQFQNKPEFSAPLPEGVTPLTANDPVSKTLAFGTAHCAFGAHNIVHT